MKKIVRLTETDLIKLVKRVINENRKINTKRLSFFIKKFQ